jgi:LPS O-antigen subunit length determinant protein (WzzB/FepE family)
VSERPAVSGRAAVLILLALVGFYIGVGFLLGAWLR